MSQRVKSVFRIAQLIDHQKEVIEMEVSQIQKRLTNEKSQLTDLENRLQEMIGRFEQGLQNSWILDTWDMACFYGNSSYFHTKIEEKINAVALVGKELKARQAILIEAYKKKKAFDIFKNKLVSQEQRAGELLEQKALDYLNLVNRSGRCA
jgi:flagellar export protein FliJ